MTGGTLLVRAARAVLDDALVADAALLVRDGAVEWGGPGPGPDPPAGVAVVDVPGTLLPGFVDVQINGAAGHDFMRASPDAWGDVGRYLLSTGTTAFVPTVISAPREAMRRAVESGTEAPRLLAAPRVLGLHLEGPFLSPSFPGAHDPDAVAAAGPDDVLDLVETGGGLVRLVTLAPERPGGLELVEELARRGVVASVGHTGATYRDVEAAVERGARSITHLFNAQRGLHHREPGVPGAALSLSALACGFILDLLHVHPAVARPFLAALAARSYLVTDAVAPAGLPPGRYRLGTREVSTEDGAPRLADGTLFGSVLSMDRALTNAVSLGFSLPDVARWTSTVPAGLVGRSDLGRLAPGARADMVEVDDDLTVRRVWIDGREVFRLEPGAGPSPGPSGRPARP